MTLSIKGVSVILELLTSRWFVVGVVYAVIALLFILTNRHRVDELITDIHGKLSASKIGTIVASTAWTYYMLAGPIDPNATIMWLAYFTATAATELFKKFLTMYFQYKTGDAANKT